MAQTLRNQSNGRVRPDKDKCILAIAQDAYDALIGTTTDFGMSVMQWIRETYKGWEVVSVPELSDANGGDSVIYLYAMGVADSGSDDQATFVQVVPTKFTPKGRVSKKELRKAAAFLRDRKIHNEVYLAKKYKLSSAA